MKINKFRGDLTDISAKKEALVSTLFGLSVHNWNRNTACCCFAKLAKIFDSNLAAWWCDELSFAGNNGACVFVVDGAAASVDNCTLAGPEDNYYLLRAQGDRSRCESIRCALESVCPVHMENGGVVTHTGTTGLGAPVCIQWFGAVWPILAEISLRSPRKLFIFIIPKKNVGWK